MAHVSPRDPGALTPEQRRVVSRIEELYADDEPLNITAVKRRHPELLRAAMAVKPFWGWRRALEAAGLSYDDIVVELTDHIVCRLCGRRLRRIGTHLRWHGTTAEDYLTQFPGEELVCEEVRTIVATDQYEAAEYALPHWERVWSPEYVLDRIAERARRGHPITSLWMERHDRNLIGQAFLKHPTWVAALFAAGVDPGLEHLATTVGGVTDAWLLDELRRRAAEKLPLDEAHVLAKQPPLHAELVKRFGSFAESLRMAGVVAPPPPRASAPDHRRAQFLAEVRVVAAYQGEKHLRELKRFQLERDGYALATFGTWRGVADAAGVPLERMLVPHTYDSYPDKKAVVREILRRHRAGIPFHGSAVDSGPDGVRDTALPKRARELFGSYAKALAAAAEESGLHEIELTGFRPLRGKYLDGSAVIAELQRRAAAEAVHLNSQVVLKENRSLYDCAKQCFPTWRDALRAAGFDAVALGLGEDQRRRGVEARYPDKASVIAAIRERARLGVPLNAASLRLGGPHADERLQARPAASSARGKKSLRAAGIDPATVAVGARKVG